MRNRSDSELAQVIKLSAWPVHHGFGLNDKADAVATLPKNLSKDKIHTTGKKVDVLAEVNNGRVTVGQVYVDELKA